MGEPANPAARLLVRGDLGGGDGRVEGEVGDWALDAREGVLLVGAVLDVEDLDGDAGHEDHATRASEPQDLIALGDEI